MQHICIHIHSMLWPLKFSTQVVPELQLPLEWLGNTEEGIVSCQSMSCFCMKSAVGGQAVYFASLAKIYSLGSQLQFYPLPFILGISQPYICQQSWFMHYTINTMLSH